MSVSRRAKVAGEKEQGAQGEVSLGLTQRSLEVGTARTLNSFVGWTEAFGGVLVWETRTGCRHEEGCRWGAGRLQPQGLPGTPCPSAHPPPDAHPHPLEQGSPASGLWTSTSCQISGGLRLEIKCTVNVTCLNHPQTIPLTPSPWTNCLP